MKPILSASILLRRLLSCAPPCWGTAGLRVASGFTRLIGVAGGLDARQIIR
jgi:hypothetical protein